MKKILVYTIGVILFMPVIVLGCSDNLFYMLCALVYGYVMFAAVKYIPLARKLFEKFVSVLEEIEQTI